MGAVEKNSKVLIFFAAIGMAAVVLLLFSIVLYYRESGVAKNARADAVVDKSPAFRDLLLMENEPLEAYLGGLKLADLEELQGRWFTYMDEVRGQSYIKRGWEIFFKMQTMIGLKKRTMPADRP